MRTDLAYEVIDLRKTDTPFEGIARVETTPGGLKVWDTSGLAQTLLYDDEDPDSFLDDETAGTIAVRTDDGQVVFEVLRLANWHDEVEPFWDSPAFTTDAEVQAYFWNKLAEAAR